MSFKNLRYENDAGTVYVTLNRPKVNALNRELLEEIKEVCEDLSSDADARVVVFRSALKHFCAGADLKERRGMSEEAVQDFVRNVIGKAIHMVGDLELPTICEVNGFALGGGLELALACDFRIFAEDAQVGLKETSLAIIPGAGGTQRLPRLIGYSNALLWILTARTFDAETSLRHGVANQVVRVGELNKAGDQLAGEIKANGPVAVRLAKKAVRMGLDTELSIGLHIENQCYNETIPTADRSEALQAFEEKRKPRWRGV